MRYLMIQNVGVCPIEGFTVLGVSTSDGVSGAIGKFGSGLKMGVNLLLRNGISPVIYAGNLKVEFNVKQAKMTDGLVEKEYGQLHCLLSGKDTDGRQVKRSEKLGFSLGYGGHDWDNLSMALREFVSNAIDRTVKEEGDFRSALAESRLAVTLVEDRNVRAKGGFTRVFIPLTDEIQRYYNELPRRFLHFSEPENLNKKVLPKANRGFSSEKAMIYKNGVFVRQVGEGYTDSLFDYNLGDELKLDESRNVNDSTCLAAAADALRDSDANIKAHLLRSQMDGRESWEGDFPYYRIDNLYAPAELKEKVNESWRQGYAKVAGDAVACRTNEVHQIQFVQRKGHKAVTIQSDNVLRALQSSGIKSSDAVLTGSEIKGRQTSPPTESVNVALNTVWRWLERVNLTMGWSKPTASCFQDISNGGMRCLGAYESGREVVYINSDIANGVSDELLQTMLEELTHYVTQAADGSRDIQEFAFKMIVAVQKL